MSDEGYLGDGDGEEDDQAEEGGDQSESSTESHNLPLISALGESHRPPPHHQFFRNVPRKQNKHRRRPKAISNGNVTHTRDDKDELQTKRQRQKSYSSVLHTPQKYLPWIPQKDEIRPTFKHKDFRRLIFEGRREQTSLICSYRHFLVEEAVFFSPKPR